MRKESPVPENEFTIKVYAEGGEKQLVGPFDRAATQKWVDENFRREVFDICVLRDGKAIDCTAMFTRHAGVPRTLEPREEPMTFFSLL